LYRLTCQGNVAGDYLYFNVLSGTGTNAITSTGYSANTWHHACVVEASVTSHNVYIDGGSQGNSTTSKTPSGVNVTGVGYIPKLTPSGYFDGDIALVGIWDVALAANEITALARGMHPKRVRPLSLKGCYAIDGIFSPEPDISGGARHLTVTGAVKSNNPPVIPYRKAWWGSIPLIEVAAGGNAPTGHVYGPLVGSLGGPV